MSVDIDRILVQIGYNERTSIAFLAFTFVVVGIRVYTRACIGGKLRADDYVMVVAEAAFVVLCTMGLKLGLMLKALFTGKSVAMSLAIQIGKWGTVVYIVATMLTYTSIALLFLRIFAAFRPQRIVIHVMLISTICFSLVYWGFSAFSCGLVYWMVPGSRPCPVANAYKDMGLASAGLNATIGWTFTTLAVNALWNANLPRRTKFVTWIILVFGTAGSVMSTIRFVMLVTPPPGLDFARSIKFACLSIVEAGFAIIAASLACLRPLIESLRVRRRSTADRTTEPSGGETGPQTGPCSTGNRIDTSTLDTCLEGGLSSPQGEKFAMWRQESSLKEAVFSRKPDILVVTRACRSEDGQDKIHTTQIDAIAGDP